MGSKVCKISERCKFLTFLYVVGARPAAMSLRVPQWTAAVGLDFVPAPGGLHRQRGYEPFMMLPGPSPGRSSRQQIATNALVMRLMGAPPEPNRL